jgi:hypothetical protein
MQVTLAVETKKKAVMDRHLDLIVGQTERYSKMLASNLLQQQQQQGKCRATARACHTSIRDRYDSIMSVGVLWYTTASLHAYGFTCIWLYKMLPAEEAPAAEAARAAARAGKPSKSVTWSVEPLPGGVIKEDGQVGEVVPAVCRVLRITTCVICFGSAPVACAWKMIWHVLCPCQIRVKKEEVDESEEGTPGPASQGTKRKRGDSPSIKQEEEGDGEEEEEGEGGEEPAPKLRAPSARRAGQGPVWE